MSANNKTWRMAASTNDVTLIGVMQGINGHVKRVRLIAGRHALGTVEVEEGRAAMTLTHAYEEMTPEKRPQDTSYGQKIETAQRRRVPTFVGLGPVLHNKLAVDA